MVKTYIDDCYIIGTSLIYLNELSFDRLERIKDNLSIRGIDTDLTQESIQNTVLEWQDFFQITENNTITLTEQASNNKFLVGMIFSDILDVYDKKRLLDSIFNCSIVKQHKILKFPKSY